MTREDLVHKLFVIDDRDKTIELCHRYLGDFEYVTRCSRGIPCQVCSEQKRKCPLMCAHDYREAEETLGRLDHLPDLVVLDLHFALPDQRLLPEDKSVLPSEPKAQEALRESWRRRQGLLIHERLRARYPRLPIVMLTTTDTELGHERPSDPLLYFCENEVVDSRSLVAEIRRALSLSHQTEEGSLFWGKSPQMAALRRSLTILARSPLPTLLEGETGTGKSFLAEHFIHPRSGAKGNLVVTDLSTIPASLLSAHLFGVKKGAYTGATADQPGVFEQAHQGTLFLDEIANLDLDLQRQLLLVLERSEVTRLGDGRPRPSMTKLVAATNQNLEELVYQGRFRSDLWMRLNPATRLRLPALRERREDIPELLRFSFEQALRAPSLLALVSAFLVRFPTPEEFRSEHNTVVYRRPNAKLLRPDAFTVFLGKTALDRLCQHPWPGNLRELRLFATNALVFSLCQLLESESRTPQPVPAPAVLTITDELVDALLGFHPPAGRGKAMPLASSASPGGSAYTVTLPKGQGFSQISRDVERQYLEQIYRETRGDLKQMAERLLGPKGTARQVHVRMNQVGLSIKALRSEFEGHARPRGARRDA